MIIVWAPPSFMARQVDYLLFSHLLKQHGNEGADKAGRLAVVPFESFNGSYTPEAKVLQPALCPPALETSTGRSSGLERYELRLALTHSVSKHRQSSL